MSIALDPTIVTERSDHYVDIETSSPLTLGMTVVDRLNVASNERNRAVWSSLLDKGRKVSVIWEIAIKRWKEALYSALR
jgi:inosine-uridine nucleoside N-ribohydrolase